MPYDITVTAEGEKKQREYTITPARANTPLMPSELADISSVGDVNEIAKSINSSKPAKVNPKDELNALEPKPIR